MAEVKIIKEGILEIGDKIKASSTVILIKSEKNIIVDTGMNGDAEKIIQGLKKEGLTPDDIHYVISTHWHPDHTWNNFLFEKATFIDADATAKFGIFKLHKLPIELYKDVKIIKTPGHSLNDISILVDTQQGKVAIVGDLIDSKEDLETNRKPLFCDDPEGQSRNRKKILEVADYIIPGHGKMFKVSHKEQKE